MIITPNAALKTTTANAWLAAMQAGTPDTTIKIYTGTKPAGPDTAPNGTTQKLLGTLTCTSGVGTVSGGAITFDTITQDASADDSGTAQWARVVDGNGAGVIDVDVSDTTGSAFLKLNTAVIAVGGPISISSFVINF